MKEKIKLVYIGDKFYSDSGTVMSSIYKVNGQGEFDRYDYGFLQGDLGRGHEVEIRQATFPEMRYMEQCLEKHKARK